MSKITYNQKLDLFIEKITPPSGFMRTKCFGDIIIFYDFYDRKLGTWDKERAKGFLSTAMNASNFEYSKQDD